MDDNTIKLVLGVIAFAVTVILVPLILVGFQILAWYIVGIPTKSEDQKTSKTYALWLGWGTFVLVLIMNLFTNSFVPQQRINAFSDAWLYIVGGFIVGFALIAAIHSFLAARAISVLVLVLSSASVSALYFYAFVDKLRDAILVSAVSVLIGSLAYVVLFPEVVKTLRTRDY